MNATFSLLFAIAALYSLPTAVVSNVITSTSHYGKSPQDKKSNNLSHKVISICGGSTVAASMPSRTVDADSTNLHLKGNVTCLVSTSLGSTFLDKAKRISISRNATVFDLKASIQEKFPGTPPLTLQKLFFGFRALNNTEFIGNISTGNQIPILLDMITGTSSYNRTMSITQAFEAYVSVVTHQTYLSGVTRKVFDNKDLLESVDTAINISLDNPEQIETLSYREMFEVINQTVYNQHAAEIAIALEREKEPDVLAADTIAWRKNLGSLSSDDDEDGSRNPLVSAFAKQFDTNKQVALALTYYSVVLVVFSKYATSAKGSKSFLLVMVPFLWLSKLRQFRLASKVGLALFLQVAPYIDFIMPLLPAPYQVMALESKKWKAPSRYTAAASEEDEGDEEEKQGDMEVVEEEDDESAETEDGIQHNDDEEEADDESEEELRDISNEEEEGSDYDASNQDNNNDDDDEINDEEDENFEEDNNDTLVDDSDDQ